MNKDPDKLKWLILNSKEPLLFKNVVTSEILNWDLQKWNHMLKNTQLEFRSGVFDHTKEPQWERKTNCLKKSFDYFLNQIGEETKQWFYFDYKYLKDWFNNCEELRNNISFASLGFPNITADDCVIWVGSKGAHTPCHKDTYGFNLVFQVYGKKLWLISPPEQNLLPTRIPYEESSIYSKLNFFSPTLTDFKGFTNCRKIILDPGDVLFLPHQWWHYVENLDTAISINVWLPLPQDNKERFKESIVQFFAKQMAEISEKELKDHILNPNMDETILNNDLNTLLQVINTCKELCKEKLGESKKSKLESTENDDNDENVIHDEEVILGLVDKCDFIETIPKLSKNQIDLFLQEQSSRFEKKHCDDVNVCTQNNILELFDVLSDQDVVTLISQKLLGKNK